MAKLIASNLAKAYKGREVVQDVSLHLESGQVVGLLGPNGAGKTTCFYMIIGIIQADRGTIELNGEDITRHAQFVGYGARSRCIQVTGLPVDRHPRHAVPCIGDGRLDG